MEHTTETNPSRATNIDAPDGALCTDCEDTRLSLEGLRCSACAPTVEAALRQTPGVHSATVSLGTGEARVIYDR